MEGMSSGVRFSDWYRVIETLPSETGEQVHTHRGHPHIITWIVLEVEHVATILSVFLVLVERSLLPFRTLAPSTSRG